MMSRKWTKALVFLIALVIMLGVVACGNSEKPEVTQPPKTNGAETETQPAVKQDTLTVAFRSEAPNLDPHNNGSLTAFAVERQIFDRLVDKDANGTIIPMLAKEWEVMDGTTIRFFLRDDVKFHNGEKLTAEDVVYTIQRAEVMSGSKAYMSAFDGANTVAVDEYTVDIKTHEPFAAAFNYLTSARGNIVCKKACEEMGVDAHGRNPVGSGPFKFVNWTTGDRITLIRNDEYWGEKPVYINLICRFITEDNSRAIELETGGVDIALHIPGKDVEALNNNPDTQAIVNTGFSYTYIAMNTQDFDVFKDVRVRQALAMALDQDALIKIVWNGYADVADCDLPSNFLGYKSKTGREYNPEKAKILLEDVGFDFNQEIVYSIPNNTDQRNLSEAVHNMWSAIGIKVKIETYEQATLTEKGLKGEIMMYSATESAATGDPDNALYFYKDGTTGRSHNDDHIRELIAKGRQTYDNVERTKIYNELVDYLWDYCGRIPIAYNSVIYGTRSNIENFNPEPGYVPDFTTVTFK